MLVIIVKRTVGSHTLVSICVMLINE